MAGIFYFQRHYATITDLREYLVQYSMNEKFAMLFPANFMLKVVNDESNKRIQLFLKGFDRRKWQRIENLAAYNFDDFQV